MTVGGPPEPAVETAMEWAARRFGPVTLVADHSWSHGETCVVRVDSDAGPLIVKAFRKRAHFERESDGYRFAAPLLGDAVPQLLGSDADALVLALGVVPGDLALARHELDPETPCAAPV
jgi:hypothetical protein